MEKKNATKFKLAKPGILHIIYGCMWAGKTTRLKDLLYSYRGFGHKVIFFSHDRTDRSREKRINNPLIKSLTPIYIEELNKDTIIENDIKVIGIDESQFFNERIIGFVIKYLELNKIIILSGLNGTYEAKTFGFVHNLVPYASEIEILHAECEECKKDGITEDASFTARVSTNKDLVVIGDEHYMPLCANHYRKHIGK
jgi:thymidine kinase